MVGWLMTSYDWRLLLLTAVLALVAGVSFIRLYHRARNQDGRPRLVAVVVAAATLGCGVWSAHFAGLLAYRPTVLVGYDIGGALLAFLVTALVAGAGLAVAAYRPSAKLLAGALIGLGIAGMHQFALQALQVSGHVTSAAGPTAVSIAIGVALGMAAFHLAASRDQWLENAGAVGLFAMAILVQHLIAMGTLEIIPGAPETLGPSLSKTGLAVTIAGAMAFVGVMGGAGSGGYDIRGKKLSDALDQLSVGLLIFDADERVLVCNKPYQETYNVPPHVVTPGQATLTDLLQFRTRNGTFREDPQQYLINLRTSLQTASSTHREPTLVDGRVISVSTHPMAGGGWVAIHENISERKHAQQEHALSVARDRRRVWIEEAVSSFRAKTETTLQAMSQHSEAMNSIATTLLKMSARTSDAARAALDSSHEASAGADSAASATLELTESIVEIDRQLNHTVEAVTKAVHRAEKSDTEIIALTEAAQTIGDIVQFIQHIAGQIKMLSLNAAIEAARAGTAGNGFSVVAAEVKTLSVQTATAAEDIARQIALMQHSSGQAIDAIRTIAKQVQDINTFSSEAAASVQQQGRATREISDCVAGASDSAKTVLEVLMQVSSDAAGTSDSARSVLNASHAMDTAATMLREQISQFLGSVAETANESLLPNAATHS